MTIRHVCGTFTRVTILVEWVDTQRAFHGNGAGMFIATLGQASRQTHPCLCVGGIALQQKLKMLHRQTMLITGQQGTPKQHARC